jgi:hypothetical protein
VNRIQVSKLDIDERSLFKRRALESDCQRVISEPTVICENGKPIIVYDRFNGDLRDLEWSAKTTRYQTGKRTTGLVSTSRIFGFRPNNEIRNLPCSMTSYMMEQPKQSAIILRYAKQISSQYQQACPEEYAEQLEAVSRQVLPEWRIGLTPFTSGIINKNNPLKYHYDTGNFSGLMSCMIVLKNEVQGGHLSIPKYGIKLDLSNGALVFFDGQSILHGVTPIVKESYRSYRYSLVFYSLKKMCNCLPISDELKRIRVSRTKREFDKIK